MDMKSMSLKRDDLLKEYILPGFYGVRSIEEGSDRYIFIGVTGVEILKLVSKKYITSFNTAYNFQIEIVYNFITK